ncbi:hypothetical protein B0T26DRAFT_757430 [Lasiosphaeria miniovina]|uniref:DUF676 domain-containing protein n=1 Tax=Lasiosphaeria miniovina TaxID=1954250 RepID=A0AA39ZUU0_9PEZI|nr:uncharacterized protein B0T26DRAFT_757430 [Lasiosphaeria miniovina]KAK0703935.1 hypothetical protein B0T26DRAFT_757430 [Lasiosphaeria miniovina]
MERILLLCFLHGFKARSTMSSSANTQAHATPPQQGDDDTFGDFPQHLQDTVTSNLPDHKVASVVYPKYETKGELAQSTEAFLGWLKERVMDLRKEHLDKPWPPNDRRVGVVLVAHSMGGFVASDCLFRILDERRRDGSAPGPMFPLIQGVLAFDTPYNGLARSMFVYGAFSNYQKVSNVFNVMTALSAAAPAGLARLAAKRTAAASAATRRTSSPAWKAWQLIAVRTGTVGAIAAGGVAAYMHRRQILDGVRSVRGLKREHVVQGYQQSVDALGQGLAYVNRGNVGASFAWLADHFTFVGALLKQNELNRRLERLASLRGVGVRDFYASLGENGVWSGGYFVPERTFCAVPVSAPGGDNSEQAAREAALFSRHVIPDATDEIVAHMSLFKPDRNADYERMTSEAAQLVVAWFGDDADVYDDPKFAEPAPAESAETEILAKAAGEGSASTEAGETEAVPGAGVDESPIDIAAAASLVPLPDCSSGDLVGDGDGDDDDEQRKDDADADADAEKQRQAYLAHLLAIAQSTGTNLRSYLPPLPAGVARVSLPSVSMPSMPSIPSMPAMPSISIPRVGSLFSRKAPVSSETAPEPAAAASTSSATTAPADASSATPTDNAAAGGEQDKNEDGDGDEAKPDVNAAATADAATAAPS